MWRRFIFLILWTVASIGCSLVRLQASEDLSTLVCKAHDYKVRYPRSWRAEGAEYGLRIFNFPLSRAVRGANLPSDGAFIQILVPSQLAYIEPNPPVKLDDWVRIGTKHATVLSKREFVLADSMRKIFVVEVREQCCAVPPYDDSIDWYFERDSRFFSASITYRRGNPNTATLLNTLRQIVLSIEIMGSGGG